MVVDVVSTSSDDARQRREVLEPRGPHALGPNCQGVGRPRCRVRGRLEDDRQVGRSRGRDGDLGRIGADDEALVVRGGQVERAGISEVHHGERVGGRYARMKVLPDRRRDRNALRLDQLRQNPLKRVPSGILAGDVRQERLGRQVHRAPELARELVGDRGEREVLDVLAVGPPQIELGRRETSRQARRPRSWSLRRREVPGSGRGRRARPARRAGRNRTGSCRDRSSRKPRA